MVHRTNPDSGSPITQLEADTTSAIDRALAGVRREAARIVTQPLQIIRRNASVVNRLREANAPMIDILTGASREAVNLGADDAAEEAPPPDGDEATATRANDSTLDRLTTDLDISNRVRTLTNDAAAVAFMDTQGTLIEGAIRDVSFGAVQLVRTKLIDSYNRGRRWYATLFQYELEWISVGDGRVCSVCEPLNGTTIASTKAFTPARADFQGVPGQPPAHPRCRCYTKVVRP